MHLITIVNSYIAQDGMLMEGSGERKTTIQVTETTRDRLFKLKFRKTYDEFLNELCDNYEELNN